MFMFALFAASVSATHNIAFAFHGLPDRDRGLFSLAHLLCMEATLNGLVIEGTSTPLIPSFSAVMEMSLSGGAGLHPHAVLFVNFPDDILLLGTAAMAAAIASVLTSILDKIEDDLIDKKWIEPNLQNYFMRNSGTFKQLTGVLQIWSGINYMMKTVLSACFACCGRAAEDCPVSPLPVNKAAALAQREWRIAHPTDDRSTNLYPRSHHCSGA